jgi:hypothetical protein
MFVLLRMMVTAYCAATIDRRAGNVTSQRSRKFRRPKNEERGCQHC